jgi:putative transposase
MLNKKVPLKKGYKYRIYPTKQQEEQLAQLFGCSRYVYNKLLEENNKAYELYKTTKDKVHLKNFFKTKKLSKVQKEI